MKSFFWLTLLLVGCGPQGLQGVQGIAGPPGTPGSSCTVSSLAASDVAPNGGALMVCPDGSQALVLNGTNGAPGTMVQPVQFCPGSTAYPNEFDELGFCINKKLYAVYSANNGFLTEVPPGTYSSNAIGSTCTFRVLPNCDIKN